MQRISVVDCRSTARKMWLIGALLCMDASYLGAQNANVRSVSVLSKGATVELEIESSERLVPEAQVLTNPDRLVLDFANAKPAATLRSHSVDHGTVKNVRVGLFSVNPPTTRVVVDLTGPTPYQVFPEGRAVIVKLGEGVSAQAAPAGASTTPAVVQTNYVAGASAIQPVRTKMVQPPTPAPALPPKPVPLVVTFRDGLLAIHANRVSLSEVLSAVQQQTHAEIPIPAGAEQETVAVSDGPAPAAEVLSRLLNGSRFNFMIINSAADPRVLAKVLLTPRPEGSYIQNPPVTPQPGDEEAATLPPQRMPERNEDVAMAEPQEAAQDDSNNPPPNNAAAAAPTNTFPNAPAPVNNKPNQQGDSPDY